MAEETTPLLKEQDATVSVNSDGVEDEQSFDGCAKYSICNPRKTIHRFIVLIFMCFLGFGSYFCYDNPAALQDNIMTDMKMSTTQFSELYSWYSWPNVFLCMVGGFLIDRVFGIRWGAIIFSIFILGGQIVFALGAYVDRTWVMYLGRFIFGIGGESLAVSQNTYAVSWFKGRELNMVFGLQLSFARVGSTVNLNTMTHVYKWVSQSYSGHVCLGITLFIATCSCMLSQLCAFFLGYLDWRAEKILKKAAAQTGEVIRLKDVKDFPITFWLISIICIAYYVAIFPFIGLGTVFFARKFGLSPSTANSVDSIVYLISAVASPILGILVDRTGRNLFWVFVSVLITLGSHILLAFSFLTPWFAMSLMGLGYSLLACGLWPMVALEVPENQLGTAYGIMQAIQNLGLAVVSLLSGVIVDHKGYFFLELFYVECICVSLISTVILFLINANRGGTLNLSVSQRTRREEEQRARDEEESEKLLASGSMADVTPHDLLQPRSDFYIRNRYLSRIGAKLPAHYDITTCALIHRTGLK